MFGAVLTRRTFANLLEFLTKYHFDDFDRQRALQRDLFFYLLRVRPFVRLLLVALGTGFAVSGMGVAFFQKQAIDQLAASQPDFSLAVYFFISAFVLLCLNKTLEVVVRVAGLRESNLVESWLSDLLYTKALNLHYEERNKQPTGQTIALMANHMSMISFFFTELFPPMFTSLAAILLAPLGMSYIFQLNPLAVYGVVAFALLTCFIFAHRSSALFQHYKVIDEKRLGYINEWLRNIKTLKSLSWVPVFERRIFHWSRVFTRQRVKMTAWAQFMNAFAEALPHLINFAGISTLLYLRDQPTSPGELFGLLWILGVFLTGPLKSLPWIFVISLDAHASMRRIAMFLNLPEIEGSSASAASDLPVDHTDQVALEVRHLNLELGHRRILSDINLTLRKNEFVCIVGPVGAGKTQLLNSLIMMTPVKFSSFKLFGRAIGTKDKVWMQNFFSMAPQDAFTLGVSLSKNVHFNFNESAEELAEASGSLSFAAYDKDLALFQDGIHTELGEFGLNLSGGQRQRLALARAHYFQRPIILLDDSLSAVDFDTEQALLENLIFGEWQQRTRVLVTHRLTVLPHADKIVFMDSGRIVATGSYQELMSLPKFREFVEQASHE